MPEIKIGSTNINTFSFDVSWDITNRTVTFDTSATSYNGSSGSGVFAVQGIGFSLVDQAGVTLLEVDFSQVDPSVDPIYVLDLSYLSFPFLFQSYAIFGSIKDEDGTVYSTRTVYKKVCQPVGLNESGYIDGMFQITPDCLNNVVTVKEITLLTYNNTTPVTVTKDGLLYYPVGTISPISFTSTPFSNNIVYTGQYRIVNTTVGTYDLGDGVFVLLSYVTSAEFPVTCTNLLADVICCLTDVYNTYQKNINTAIGQNALNKYNSVTPLLLNGLVKQFAGMDASFEAAQIRKLLNCDCGVGSIKQNEPTPVNPSVYSIVLNGACATTIGAPTIAGNTKTYTISSPTFVIAKGDTGDLAYTITTDTSVNCVTKYKITFNYTIQAGYILNAIQNDATLLQQLNSLITLSNFNIDLTGVNGKCVIDLSATNYFLSSKSPNGSVVIKSIYVNGATHTAPGGLIVSNPNAIEVWLNSLALGVYQVSYTSSTSGSYLNILSESNTYTPLYATFTVSGTDHNVPFGKTNKSIIALFQAIIDYLCAMSALQVALGANLSLCYFDYNGNVVSTSYATDSTQGSFNAGIAASICNIVARINTLTGVTCDKLKAIFIDRLSSNFITSTDRFYGTLDGSCAGITSQQAALAFINAVNSYDDVKAAFCAIDCTTPATCPDITNINIAMAGATTIGVYGATFSSVPTASQSVTVKYKLSTSSTYITATNALVLFPNGNISGTSPYTIPGLTPGAIYDVQIINNCGGVGFVKQQTVPAAGVYSGSYLRDAVIYNICGDTTVTLYSSQPFNTGITMFTDAGLTTPLTGYNYIASSTGAIFNISTTTGVVGSATGSTCNSGTPGTFALNNSNVTICTTTPVTLYTSGAFAVGKILYTDSALTSPRTGYAYVMDTLTNKIYNLNTSTGLVGADTGLNCTGSATLTFSYINAGGFQRFAASLSRAVDATITVTRMFADGFPNTACTGGTAVSSSQNNASNAITAGSLGFNVAPGIQSGTWASAIRYDMYNIIINGSSHVNGDVITVGSFSVVVVIPACAS